MPFSAFYAFCAFGAFWCVQNLFVKKNEEFKTALITSFILLLNGLVALTEYQQVG